MIARVDLGWCREEPKTVAHLDLGFGFDLQVGAAWHDFEEVPLRANVGIRQLPNLGTGENMLMHGVGRPVDFDFEPDRSREVLMVLMMVLAMMMLLMMAFVRLMVVFVMVLFVRLATRMFVAYARFGIMAGGVWVLMVAGRMAH
jgi:hypothetical protein